MYLPTAFVSAALSGIHFPTSTYLPSSTYLQTSTHLASTGAVSPTDAVSTTDAVPYSTTVPYSTNVSYSVANPSPNAVKRYTNGWCGVHVQQFQKNENGVGGEYQFTVIIKDAIGTQIGGVKNHAITDYGSLSVFSQLPATLDITIDSVDNDPIQFAYSGQVWSSSNGCSTGGYDSGSRQMDCGFSC